MQNKESTKGIENKTTQSNEMKLTIDMHIQKKKYHQTSNQSTTLKTDERTELS